MVLTSPDDDDVVGRLGGGETASESRLKRRLRIDGVSYFSATAGALGLTLSRTDRESIAEK